MINIMFSFYEVLDFFEEKIPLNLCLKQWAYDYGQNYLILLYKHGAAKNEKKRKLKIHNVSENRSMISITIKDQDFIGRLRSSLFTLVNGHFYFGNKVYKIRYDLLDTSMVREITEAQLIDYYQDLLGVKPGEKIHSSNPLLCIDYHKLSFFTNNSKMMMPMRIIMLPFMHERKIYLNKSKPG